MSMREAAIEVLEAEGRPMKVRELWHTIERQGLYKSTGATPWYTLSAVMQRGEEFVRTAPSTYDLRGHRPARHKR
jgi:HB1, ASXL, restriction endonuclease HTH domain